MDNGDFSSEVQGDLTDGRALGVTCTPTFLINGRLVSGAQPPEVFRQLIEAELGNA